MQAAYVPGYLPPTTYCTKLQNSDQFHALIELVHAQWAADGVVDEVKRQVLRDRIFTIHSLISAAHCFVITTTDPDPEPVEPNPGPIGRPL